MLAFIDESGFPNPNDDTLRPILASVCIPEDVMRGLIQKMYSIKMEIFGHTDVELKANKVLVKKSLYGHSKNKMFADRVVNEIIRTTSDLSIFAIVMNKPNKKLRDSKDNFPNHYRFLLQRIDGRAQQTRGNIVRKAFVCFDSQDDGNDEIISNKMKNYLFKSQEGKRCYNTLESAFFVNSKVEEGIQLADLCAGIIRHFYEMKTKSADDAFRNWINELYDSIAKRATTQVDGPNGAPLFPIYEMPNRYFDYEEDE